MYKHGPCAGLCALPLKYINTCRYFVVALDLISTWLFACLSLLQQLVMTLGYNSFMGFISDPFIMFVILVTMTSGRAGKTCRCTIQEKTGNVVAHLLSYLF